MIVVLILTAIFHFVMEEHLRPLYEFLPVTLEDFAADAENERWMGETGGRNTPTTGEDVGTSSAIELSSLEKRDTTTTQPNNSSSLKLVPPKTRERAITNASTITAASARHALSKIKQRAQLSSSSTISHIPTFPGLPTSILSAHPPSLLLRREVADQLGAAIASYPDELTELSPEERNAQLKAAFQDPVTREPRPVVWIPADEAGVAEGIVGRVAGLYGRSPIQSKELDYPLAQGKGNGGMKMGSEGGTEKEGDGKEDSDNAWLTYSCEGAQLRKGGKVQITRPAPDVRADWCLEWQL